MFQKFKPWQISILISSTVVVGVASAMAITNPSREAYKSYAADKMQAYLKTEVCPSEVPEMLISACKSAIDIGEKPMQKLIEQSTERHNYLLFSIYETNLSLGGNLPIPTNLPSYEFRTLGIFQNFWIYQSQEQ